MTEKVLDRPLLPELLQPKEFWTENGLTLYMSPILESPIAHAADTSVTHSAIHLQVVNAEGALIRISELNAADIGIDEIQDICELYKVELLKKYLAGRRVTMVGILPLFCYFNGNDEAVITFALYTKGFMIPM